jgi:hypothetical protein
MGAAYFSSTGKRAGDIVAITVISRDRHKSLDLASRVQTIDSLIHRNKFEAERSGLRQNRVKEFWRNG